MSKENGLTSVDEMFNQPPKRRYKVVTLPLSGFKIRIQSLTELQLSRYQSVTYTASGTGLRKSKLEDASLRLIRLCAVDADGNRLFTNAQITRMAEWDSADTQYLSDECNRHCGINRQDIEDLAKKLEETSAD